MDARKQADRQRRLTAKLKCLHKYGKYRRPQCKWRGCQERNPDALTIDHVWNDGAQHRKLNGRSSTSLHTWLRKHNYPSGYQVLCASHQQVKELARRRLELSDNYPDWSLCP